MLLDELSSEVLALAPQDLEVEDYAIGAKYAYVIVKGSKGRAMGTSYFPMEDMTRGYSRVPSFDILTSMLSSLNIFERSLGIAFLNAISQYLLWNMGYYRNFELYDGNIVEDVARLSKGERIVVVGNMVPLVKKLEEKGFKVEVLERNPRFRYKALPDCMAPRIIPEADILIVTGTSMINDTIDNLISLGRNAKIRILVGPTAAVYPSILLNQFTHIASLKIEDLERVREIIKLGGGRWDFSPYAREYIVKGKYR